MLNNIVENWYVIVGVVAVIAVAAVGVYKFYKLPTSKQIEKIENWLLYACIESEKALGSGTGNIKLRMVYDGFISKFKFLSTILSFEQFSTLVDEALKQMKELLETNDSVKNYIKGADTVEKNI